MTNLMTRRWLRIALIIIGVSVGYFATGRFLLVLGAPPNGAVTTVWLPSGISVAALILFGPVAAIGAFAGSLVLELKNGTPWAAGLVVGLANAGSELLCYALIVGRSGRLFSLLSTGNILRFVIAAGLGSAVSAFVGVSTYVIAGRVPATAYWPTWLTWFGSMVVGIILITPFLVSSTRDWPFPGSRQRYREYAAALAALAIAAFLWQGPVFSRNTDEPVILVVILVFLWIAFRFPPVAMTLAVFSFTVAAVAGAVLRLRHIPPDAAFYSIFALQMMLGGLAAIGYLLDSLVTAQKCAAEALQADIGRRKLAEEEVNRLNAELEHQVEVERERSERNSRNNQKLLQLVVDTIPIRLFWKDLNLVFLGCNRLFAQDAGYRNPDDLVGSDDYSQVWSAQADLYRRDDFEVIASGIPRLNYEEPQDTPDGKKIWLSTSKVPIRDANDQIIGVLGTYEDITPRKLAEEEQLRNQKLAILGQLSGSVGHELRNPLGVMSNAVYFLKMVLADADEMVSEYLDIITKEINISLRIITDLLDFARTREPQIEVVTARSLIDESLSRCAIPEDVGVQVDLADNLPPLKIDPLQMGQVMQNLITNGIQAMPTGGSLTIRGKQVNEGMIGLEVADTGEGVSPENMDKLFQPLFTTKAKGIGLGLVVCKNLVEANGGRIEVKSEPGAGTTFTVSLSIENREHKDLTVRS